MKNDSVFELIFLLIGELDSSYFCVFVCVLCFSLAFDFDSGISRLVILSESFQW